jgi:hypothetical protein
MDRCVILAHSWLSCPQVFFPFQPWQKKIFANFLPTICCKTARISFSGLFFFTKSRMLSVGTSHLSEQALFDHLELRP